VNVLQTDHSALSTRHSALKKAVFVDKDGTLIEDVPYSCDVARIRLLPGAGEGLRRLEGAGFHVIVVSNQAGVAHGYFEERALWSVAAALEGLLASEGVTLKGFYYCPHHPEGMVAAYAVECLCRKPGPGLLQRAANEWGVSLAESWMIGDILHDVEAGHRAGCCTVLIDNGHETEWRLGGRRWPDHVARDLKEAARLIVGCDEGEASDAVEVRPAYESV